MSEIEFQYNEICWFAPAVDFGSQWDMEGASQLLPASSDRRVLKIGRNMWGGPIRFEVLVDVDEEASAAEFGQHERYEASFRGEACQYLLHDMGHGEQVLDSLTPGDYRAILLVTGIDPDQFDSFCEESNERYRLLLQPIATAK